MVYSIVKNRVGKFKFTQMKNRLF